MGDPFLFQRDLSGGMAVTGAHPVTHTRVAAADLDNADTPTVLDPVTVDEAKAHLNVRHDRFDTYIGSLITAAREAIEDAYEVAMLNQTVTAIFRDGAAYADLPVDPVASVEGAVRESYGGTQEHAAENLRTVGRRVSLYSRAALSYGGDTLTVTYTAGHGTTRANVPQRYKQAVLVWVADLYANRGTFDLGSIAVAELPGPVRALLPRRLVA